MLQEQCPHRDLELSSNVAAGSSTPLGLDSGHLTVPKPMSLLPLETGFMHCCGHHLFQKGFCVGPCFFMPVSVGQSLAHMAMAKLLGKWYLAFSAV